MWVIMVCFEFFFVVKACSDRGPFNLLPSDRSGKAKALLWTDNFVCARRGHTRGGKYMARSPSCWSVKPSTFTQVVRAKPQHALAKRL